MKFTRITKAVALGGAVAMLASIAACGSSPSSSDSSNGGGKTEILVWSWDSTLPRTVKAFEKSQSEYQGKGH